MDCVPENTRCDFVSVIIPTYKDWERLNQTLIALANQTYPDTLFEVIIVNNCPADAMPQFIIQKDNFKFIEEANGGSYHARNSGIKLSKGNIIAFTDSDCLPSNDWISKAIELFGNNEDASRIGGKVKLFYDTNQPSISELYENIYSFRQSENVKNGKSVTANMFTKRFLFDTIGYFNGELISGGDFEWSHRATMNGSKIIYGQSVIVHHPARKHFKQLKNKAKRTASNFIVNKKEAKLFSILLFIFNLRPPLKELKRINKIGPKYSINQKILVFLLRYYIRVIQSFTVLKIKLNAERFDDRDFDSRGKRYKTH